MPPTSFRPNDEDGKTKDDYWEAFAKLCGLYVLSERAKRERDEDGWRDLTGNGGGGYSFNDAPAGAILAPQYLAAPYVFELNDEAIFVFNEYVDKVNKKAEPEYEPGGDEIAGAYWRKSTDKVLQLAAHLRLFDWTAEKSGAITDDGEPEILLDADVLRRSIELNTWYAENYIRIMNEIRNIDGAKPTTKGPGYSPALKERIIEKVEKLYERDGKPVKKSAISKSIRGLNAKGKGAGETLKNILVDLTDRGEIFGNLKDGFFPAFDDATDDEDDADE